MGEHVESAGGVIRKLIDGRVRDIQRVDLDTTCRRVNERCGWTARRRTGADQEFEL